MVKKGYLFTLEALVAGTIFLIFGLLMISLIVPKTSLDIKQVYVNDALTILDKQDKLEAFVSQENWDGLHKELEKFIFVDFAIYANDKLVSGQNIGDSTTTYFIPIKNKHFEIVKIQVVI